MAKANSSYKNYITRLNIWLEVKKKIKKWVDRFIALQEVVVNF